MFRSGLVEQFRKGADAVESLADLATLSRDFAQELGFEYLAILHSISLLRHSSRLIRLDNYPADWDRRLIGRGAKVVDPILSIARRRVSAFRWSDVVRGARFSSEQVAILAEASRRGIREGVTIPANVPGEPEGSVSFATGRSRPIGRERLMMADAAGRAAFEAARRINGFAAVPECTPHLGPRVQECIFWIAQGKTDQDVADILGIGIETVRTYVKSAFRSLNVVTRGQLVHEALRIGMIDFVTPIPPFG